MTIDLYDLRRREVQALGAALSCRDWYMTEKAYNSLRDKLDNAGFTVSGPPTTPKPPAGGDAGAVERDRLVQWVNEAAERATKHGNTEGVWLFADQWRAILAALALSAPVVEGWQEIETANRDSMTEIDMWCASAEADGEGWNLRGILMIGTPDWIKREDGSDYFPHENGGFLTHWRPVPAPPVAARAALSEGRSHG